MQSESDKKQKDDLGLSLFFENQTFDVQPRSKEEQDIKINILFTSEEYQEVEVICRGIRKKRRLTKFLPPYFASNFETLRKSVSNDAAKPSGNVGATNLGNLSHGSNMVLKEKFLRILAKINHVSEIKTAEKIWDSEERIPTSDKAILLAVANSMLPDSQKLNREIVSQRSHEVADQESFKKFVGTMIDLTRDSKKLAQFLFGDALEKMGEERATFLTGCLRNILSEADEKKCVHQIKFLEKILGQDSKNYGVEF